LADAQKRNPNFTLVSTMTEMEKSNNTWNGETGFVTKAMLMKSVKDLHIPIFYISGPPAMVAAMRKILDDSGVNDDKIRTEEFSGY
jgi:Na+-transporting NADH:ubiquinone oxidoreductase subunit NqrF